jgi:hypothetical protein
MPKSLVIHVEAHKNIPDEYRATIVFADGETKDFIVPVLKYWELSDDYLIGHNLFPLLPLQIFLLRAELDRLTKNKDEPARQAAILKTRDIAEKIVKEVAELNEADKLIDEDYKKVLSAIMNLFVHLNNRYKVDETLNEGVKTMVELNFNENIDEKSVRKRARVLAKTLAEPLAKQMAEQAVAQATAQAAAEAAAEATIQAEKKSKIEVAKKMLLKNKPIDEIIEFTGLTEKEINEI